MTSSFKGFDIFGSGPHQFSYGEQSRRIVSLATLAQDVTQEGTLEFGNYELRVFVRGRLVAGNESAMRGLRDAIVAQVDASVGSGILKDSYGQEWSTMKLISFEEFGAVSRGRELSVGYAAEFGQLASG